MTRTLLVAVTALLFIHAAARGQSTMGLPDVGIEQRLDQLVPRDVPFRNELGDTVTLARYFGTRPVILVLGYFRCPRLCSVSLNNLASSLGKIEYQAGKDFDVVIVSIDPRETPELAAAKKSAIVEQYASPGAAAGWHFLTGDEPAIQRLAGAVGFRYSYDAKRDLYDHASGIMIVTPDARIARYFFGLDYSPRDLRFGLEDASAGKIGSPFTQPLRLLCFAYDPDAGGYTLMTMRLVRAGAAFTVLVLSFLFLAAWWRERRNSKKSITMAN